MHRKLDRNDELKKWRWRYDQRAKQGKGRLLDEFCGQYGFSRKHAIKLLGDGWAAVRRTRRQAGPQPKYEPVAEVVGRIWRAAEQLCGKRLACALPLWLPHYQRHYGKAFAFAERSGHRLAAALPHLGTACLASKPYYASVSFCREATNAKILQSLGVILP